MSFLVEFVLLLYTVMIFSVCINAEPAQTFLADICIMHDIGITS